ncbi:MAG TPA: molybdopterin cofactor-binding domain-containing protein [Acidimicrobiales bacterium]|jgi:isoquinoline 1-oxidoreductase beta subunit
MGAPLRPVIKEARERSTAQSSSNPPKQGLLATGQGLLATGIDRRRFLGFVLAAPTLVVAARLVDDELSPAKAGAVIPSLPEPADLFDLGDLQDLAAAPTSGLISVVMNSDGTASFALPRAEVGQGITTSMAMIIAEEMDLPLNKVIVTLADATPALELNQFTGGSNSTRSLYQPLRIAAAGVRLKLLEAAAAQLGVIAETLTTKEGVISAQNGQSLTYGSLATTAAASQTTPMNVVLKEASNFSIIGTPQYRTDALASVTGTKVFTMDIHVPNALPTMVCRPPTINGTVSSVNNLSAVTALPGITDVVPVSTGVAVRGATFGQCIDAVNALDVTWGPGTEDGQSDATILEELSNEIPFLAPPLLGKSVGADFTFYFRSNSPLETNCAIADVRADRAEIWSSLKAPILAQEVIAKNLGLPIAAVTVHVVLGGGSFGRHLFSDAAQEAAEISQAMGKPVKLMWHRTDDFRHGRTHPMAVSRVRASYAPGNVFAYEQRHTSVSTDFTHGFGEIITSVLAELPLGNLGYAETIFELTQSVPYNFGATDQVLNEVDMGFHTGSMRNIYSPDTTTAMELIVDQLANGMSMDPYAFRRQFLKDARSTAVLDRVAQVGNWGRSMPAGTAQGIAFHSEYKGVCAALVEIDCTPATVNRVVENAATGPRVTKAVFVVDVGLPINPLGLQAQIMGGLMDGIAQTLTSSLHFKDGLPLEGSWDNYFYTRQWNVPPEVQIIVMPPTTGEPGGAGEFGVAASMAAVACAYARATGTMPTSFPINHNGPLGFTPSPVIPPLPPSLTDGLSNAF